MNDRAQKLAIGCLLHDFGKLLYRYNDGRNHSTSGYDYLKNIDELRDQKEILNCVRYHHGKLLANSNVDDNDICYITYIADNIASASDRKQREDNGDGSRGYVRDIPFESIFNILNGNKEKKVYKPDVLSSKSEINYPTGENIIFSESFYGKIVDNIKDAIRGINYTKEYINSLLQVMESNLTFIPSSTDKSQYVDISLYDHSKMTAAFGLCIEQYLVENEITNYKEELFKKTKEFYKKKVFGLLSIDLSGIQSFIYNISDEKALKNLRARSFYLEMLMEHCVDELIERCGLCRANVMYTGGGHTYIFVPATSKCRKIIENFKNELNQWFMDNFDIGLYAAFGYVECSSEELENKENGSYRALFRKVSTQQSKQKLARYSAEDILKLNGLKTEEHGRECKVCHRSDKLVDDKCSFCIGLEALSDMIIDNRGDNFFTIIKGEADTKSVPMPFGCKMKAYKADELKNQMNNSEQYVRSYAKNSDYTGYKISKNLWVGDYAAEKTFGDLVAKSEGIKRLGVIRADIDSLGQAFVSGFGENEICITRTAVFTRKLSEFFKLHINKILANGVYQLYSDKEQKHRNAVIVYSGGDDVFVVGGWDDIIGFAIDLHTSLKKFSQGKLTISAGIGIYPEKYPIAAMAKQTGELEDVSKKFRNEEKNAVTLFDDTSTYNWDEFIDCVLGEKLKAIKEFISVDGVHSKAMLYKMLTLIRSKKEENRLNIARFAYLIARLRPNEKNTDENKLQERLESYNNFAKKMYNWIQSARDCRQLVTAIYIYVYMNREREVNGNDR